MAIPIIKPPLSVRRSIFDCVPDGLFAPLASPSKHKYWALLRRLHNRRFGPEAPLPPIKGFAIREILQEIEDVVLIEQWDDPEEDGTTIDPSETGRAYAIFRRLVSSRWLKLERDVIEKKVVMEPSVNQFLDSLMEFADAEPVRLDAKIRSIDLNISAVVAGKGGGSSLSEAASQTRALLERVRNTGTNVRDIMSAISRDSETAQFVNRFFTDYIQQVFIVDYAELRTSEHPLAKRPQILRAVETLQTTPEHRERLIAGYMSANCDRRGAEERFERDIQRIQELTRIDEYLDRLDSEVRLANRRALAFLQFKVKALRPLDALVRQAIERCSIQGVAEMGDPFPTGDLVSSSALAEPRVPIARLPVAPLRKAQASPEQMALTRVLLKAREARKFTPAKLMQFLSSRLVDADKSRLASDEVQLTTAEDVRSYQGLAAVAMLSRSKSHLQQRTAQSMVRGYRISVASETEEVGRLITGRRFEVSIASRAQGNDAPKSGAKQDKGSS